MAQALQRGFYYDFIEDGSVLSGIFTYYKHIFYHQSVEDDILVLESSLKKKVTSYELYLITKNLFNYYVRKASKKMLNTTCKHS